MVIAFSSVNDSCEIPEEVDDMKYIFITGGVVSSLGKGLTAAALGALPHKQVFGLQDLLEAHYADTWIL